MENDDLILSEDGKTLIGVKDKNATNVVIPDGVEAIGEMAFLLCTSLQSIDIPNSVTTIGNGAFGFCTSLNTIEVSPNNTTYKSIDGILFSKNEREFI